jgi:sRNA-binding carbon storage regulator CsrA
MLFVGTNHFDPEGPEKLELLLREHNGVRIGCETPPNVSIEDSVAYQLLVRERLRAAVKERFLEFAQVLQTVGMHLADT